MELSGKTAFITGGASGLGLATAENFVAAGASVFLFDLDAERVRNAAETIGSAAGWAAGDVSDEDQVKAAVSKACEQFGTIHINVNCAGIGGANKTVSRDGPMPLEKFARVVRVNLIGTFNVLRLCAEVMQHNDSAASQGERGVIINVASVAAYDGQVGQAAYSASKGGIAAMTLPITRDLAGQGIRVMTIAPGLFETPLLNSLPQEVKDSLAAMPQFPKRLGLPAEFAETAAHIVRNTYLNGEVIRLDAGIRMAAR